MTPKYQRTGRSGQCSEAPPTGKRCSPATTLLRGPAPHPGAGLIEVGEGSESDDAVLDVDVLAGPHLEHDRRRDPDHDPDVADAEDVAPRDPGRQREDVSQRGERGMG